MSAWSPSRESIVVDQLHLPRSNSSVTGTDAARRVGTSGRARGLLAVADVVSVALGVLLGTLLQWLLNPMPADVVHRQLLVALVALPLWPIAMSSQRLYLARYVARPTEELRRVLRATFMGALALVGVAFALHIQGLSRLWVAFTFVGVSVALTAERSVARVLFRRAREHGRFARPVIVVGAGPEARAVCASLRADAKLGYAVVGVTGDDPSLADAARAPYLGSADLTPGLVEGVGATSVIIVTSGSDVSVSNMLVRRLTDAGIHVELSVTLRDIAPTRIRVQPLGRYSVAYVEPVIRHGWRQVAKRTFDVVFASLALLAASPVLLLAAAAILIEGRGGPVFFRQKRVGLNGRQFDVLKLRTMVVGAEAMRSQLEHANEADGPLFKMRGDPRVTRVGRVLRKLSIDEIPQFFNVLANDMSVVGPRPALPSEMSGWTEDLMGRLRVKPGITGMWQVHGRSSTDFGDYERLDLYYVDNWSLFNDIAIVLRTVPAVLLRKGAF